MKIGRFISIEGGEGVGKSLFLTEISSKLSERGIVCALSREPGGTPIANKIREVFSSGEDAEDFTPEGEFLLVSAARAQHVKHFIEPKLNVGHWVICDRFSDSSRVYQGHLRGLDSTFIESVIRKSTFGITPDLTFLLDCDTALSQSRVSARGKVESRYDAASLQTHETLRQGFLKVSREFPERMKVLDASRPVCDSVMEAMRIIEDRFHV